MATGVGAVGLNPDGIREVEWWEDPSFGEREMLEAAEIVAFDVLEPALRSRGGVRDAARTLLDDSTTRSRLEEMLRRPPTGRLTIPTLADALVRITLLEGRIDRLEATHG